MNPHSPFLKPTAFLLPLPLSLSLTLMFYVLSLHPASAQINGHAKGSAYALGQQYDPAHVFAELGMQTGFRTGQMAVYGDVRFRSGRQFDEDYLVFELREAYAAYSGERLGLYLGKQIVQWGRADGFNPTGNLIRSDYFLLSGDPDDQLKGSLMARLQYRLTPQIELDVIGIPYYQSSLYRYDLFDFGPQAHFGDAVSQDAGWSQASAAARINFELPAFGFSVSGFRGYDPFYGFGVATVDWTSGQPVIEYRPEPYLKTTVGADLAVPVSRLIIRAELAWNQTDKALTDIHIPDKHLHYVAGLEASLGPVTAIMQYMGKYNPDFVELDEPVLTDPGDPMAVMDYTNRLIFYESEGYNRHVFGLTGAWNHGLSVTLSGSFGYSLVQPELTGYYLMTTGEYLIRPKISFQLADGLLLAVGGQFMDGPEKSVFEYAGQVMSGAFLELKAGF